MKRFLQGVGVGALLLTLVGLAQQSVDQPTVQRYVIYDGDESGPLLLDSQTGRTRYEQAGPLDERRR